MPKLKPIILLLLLSIQAMGQEVVTGLYVNSALTSTISHILGFIPTADCG